MDEASLTTVLTNPRFLNGLVHPNRAGYRALASGVAERLDELGALDPARSSDVAP